MNICTSGEKKNKKTEVQFFSMSELHTESNLFGLASKSFTFEKVLYSKKARRNQVRLFDTMLK